MNRFVRLGAAAVLILALVGGVRTLGRLAPKPYTVEQTIQALRNAHYLHVVKRDKAGNLEHEVWEEIGPDGYQARYRQNSPSISFYVVDDLKTCMEYRADKDKNTVILYDHKDQSYTWHYAPGRMFGEPGAGKPAYTVVAENVQYKGQPAHHLRQVGRDTDIYIDPETKLPLALGDYECSFEEPPQGTFDIVIPDGAIVVDKRPGAKPTPEPQWMMAEREKEQEKEQMAKIDQAYFEEGRRALGAGDCAKAVELLTKSVDLSSRNWAWLWLGQALQKAGDYDQAVYRLSKIIDRMAEKGPVPGPIPSYYLARGMVYQAKGMTDMARLDMEKALPKMVEGLRNARTASLFDLADDPLIIADGMREGCHPGPTREQSIVMMINRLRLVTGQDFGYDPNAGADEKEQAIAVWEQWLATAGKVQFTPEAKPLPIPPLSPAERLSRAIGEMPHTGAGAQALVLFEKARAGNSANPGDWLKLGLALYDGKYYQEGLEAFQQAEILFQNNSLYVVDSLVWQGHILDLLGRRADAVVLYQKALDKDPSGSVRHDQYGIKVDRQWIEQRLEKPFARPD